MVAELTQWCNDLLKEGKQKYPTLFARMVAVSLVEVAAVLAVDVKAEENSFLEMAERLFKKVAEKNSIREAAFESMKNELEQ